MTGSGHLPAILVAGGLLIAAAGMPHPDAEDGAAPVQDEAENNESGESGTDRDDENSQEKAGPPAAAESRPRVILQVGRHEQVAGYVEREEDDVIVLETTEGLKSFVKPRILRITRLVDPKPGQNGAVILSDGSRREGVILEDSFDEVVVQIRGIRTRFGREIVNHVILYPTVEEQYEEFRKSIQPTMYSRRLDLCRWLIDEHRYELAERELASLHADKPDLAEVAQLITFVRAQLALAEDAARVDETVRDTGSPEESSQRRHGRINPADLLPTELLSQDDVNLIRVYEIDFDRPPNVSVPPETIRRLITQYGSHPAIPARDDERNAMFRWDALDIVRVMFEVRARDLYGEIEVLTEPYALNLFRQRVHNTWLINNCATSRCHGGVSAGRLFLHNRNYRDDRVRFTNLLILDRLVLDPQRPLINYQEPINSLVIQHALPVTEARFPHPDVPGWKPVFTPANTKMLEDAVAWINSMFNNPRPEYPVEYDPPKLMTGAQGGPGDTGR